MSVTLIFPTYNCVDLLARALSTLGATTYRDFIAHVVDDGSTENIAAVVELAQRTATYPLRYDRIQRTGNSTVVVNWAALRAETPYIAYMNTDVEFPDPEWLGASMACFERFETQELMPRALGPGDTRTNRVGAVGIKQLFAPWQKQWAGMVGHVGNRYREDGTWQHLEEFVPDAQSKYREDALVEGVTGCGLITPTEVWRAAGGFSVYWPFGWDDTDYCLKMHERGLKVVCQRQHPIWHVRSASYGRPQHELYEQNRDLIRMRHGHTIGSLIRMRELIEGKPCAT